MQQVMKLIIYSIIGISIFTNCAKQTSKEISITYIYKNSSVHELTLEAYNSFSELIAEYTIRTNDSVLLSFESKNAGHEPFVYGSSNLQVTDSLVLKYDGVDSLHYLSKNSEGPLVRENYKVILDNEFSKKYIYYFK
jgi:hypothetical protein